MWKLFGIVALVAAVLVGFNKLFNKVKFNNAVNKLEKDTDSKLTKTSNEIKDANKQVEATGKVVDAAIQKTDNLKTTVTTDASASNDVQKAKAEAAGFVKKEK